MGILRPMTPDDDRYFSEEAATFGDRIAAAREAMGLSQKQLAHRLGVEKSTLAKWEDDRAEPRANRIQLLAGVLNVSILWLMSGQGDDPVAGDVEPENHRELLAELREIRLAHTQLTERLARLEKRLRAGFY